MGRFRGERGGRRTNLALLLLLPFAVGTGFLAFALGGGWVRWVVAAHASVAFAILVLAPWKSVIARRGLRRARPGTGASIVFAFLVAVALAAGIGHATGLLRTIGGITAMQLHVGAALGSIPVAVWHVVSRRVAPRPTDLSRRTLLRGGALAAGSVAAYGALTGLVRVTGLPGRGRRATGSYERGSFSPVEMPVTQWLFDGVPSIDPLAWRLTVGGNGAGPPRQLGLDELAGMAETVDALLDCTGGWFARQRWTGVRLDRLIPPGAAGRSILVRSATGCSRRLPLGDSSVLWLAIGVGDGPLSPGHGFPARLVAPGRRGCWWVKWVTAIEVDDTPWWWQPPYPLR
jgi:DMSO/TMAO reductase YedYZ molybdopterin-dependent catalytic subunit